jgi:hypothetical protein
MSRRVILPTIAFILVANGAQAGPAYSLARKALCAEQIVEVELKFDRNDQSLRVARTAKVRRRRFPDVLLSRAMATAKVTPLFAAKQPGSARPPEIILDDRLWWKAWERGTLRAIVFVRSIRGVQLVLSGVEGAPSDLEPGYDEVRSAIADVVRWRLRPGEDAFSEAEKLLAGTKNDEVARLARDYLCSGNRVGAVVRASKTGRGSPAAKIHDQLQAQRISLCLDAPDLRCSEW